MSEKIFLKKLEPRIYHLKTLINERCITLVNTHVIYIPPNPNSKFHVFRCTKFWDLIFLINHFGDTQEAFETESILYHYFKDFEMRNLLNKRIFALWLVFNPIIRMDTIKQ